MVNATSHHSHPRSIHSQSTVNAITEEEGGFKVCKSGVKVKKRPFQAENLTMNLQRLYQ